MKQNPLIDQKSVKITKEERFVRVTYDCLESSAKLPKHHVNYYIVYNERWLDIHISMLPALSQDEIVKVFEGSLRFVFSEQAMETAVH